MYFGNPLRGYVVAENSNCNLSQQYMNNNIEHNNGHYFFIFLQSLEDKTQENYLVQYM